MLERIGDEILEFKNVDTGTQIARIAEGHICFATKIVLMGAHSLTVGIPATFQAEYFDWEDSPLPEENRPIHVRIGENEVVVNPIGGVAEFDVVADYVPEGGALVVEAVGDGFGCDPGGLEVTVVE